LVPRIFESGRTGDNAAEYLSAVDVLQIQLTPFGILKFIVSLGEVDAFPNFKVGLQILLAIVISVVGRERSFSKLIIYCNYSAFGVVSTIHLLTYLVK